MSLLELLIAAKNPTKFVYFLNFSQILPSGYCAIMGYDIQKRGGGVQTAQAMHEQSLSHHHYYMLQVLFGSFNTQQYWVPGKDENNLQ